MKKAISLCLVIILSITFTGCSLFASDPNFTAPTGFTSSTSFENNLLSFYKETKELAKKQNGNISTHVITNLNWDKYQTIAKYISENSGTDEFAEYIYGFRNDRFFNRYSSLEKETRSIVFGIAISTLYETSYKSSQVAYQHMMSNYGSPSSDEASNAMTEHYKDIWNTINLIFVLFYGNDARLEGSVL